MSVIHIPIIGAPYQHQDGGLYRVIAISKSTVDQTIHVVYKHLYPFDTLTWSRPITEWTPKRFTSITEEYLEQAIKTTNQLDRRRQITMAKSVRRNLQEL